MNTVLSSELTQVLSLVENARAERLAPRITKQSRYRSANNIAYKAKQISLRNGFISFVLHKKQKKLPPGLWYKGGTARNALRQILRLTEYPIRDVDVVAIGNFSDKKLAALSHSINPDDAMFGNSIEIVATQQEYFTSRDFSCNEILCNADRLICSERAVQALLNKEIWLVTNKITPILLAKGLRLVVAEGSEGSSQDFLSLCQGVEFTPFIYNLQSRRSGPLKKQYDALLKRLNITISSSSPKKPAAKD